MNLWKSFKSLTNMLNKMDKHKIWSTLDVKRLPKDSISSPNSSKKLLNKTLILSLVRSLENLLKMVKFKCQTTGENVANKKENAKDQVKENSTKRIKKLHARENAQSEHGKTNYSQQCLQVEAVKELEKQRCYKL